MFEIFKNFRIKQPLFKKNRGFLKPRSRDGSNKLSLPACSGIRFFSCHHVAFALHNLQACYNQRSKNWFDILRHCCSYCALYAGWNISQEGIFRGIKFFVFFHFYKLYLRLIMLQCSGSVILQFGITFALLHFNIVPCTRTKVNINNQIVPGVKLKVKI